MLSIAALHTTRADYYLADLADELSFARRAAGLPLVRGRPGRWLGAGATGLGLTGPVGEELADVLAGRRPGARETLTRRRVSVGAFDLTFSAPKSASVLLALAPADVAGAALDAHGTAVATAMAYVEARALVVRRADRGDRVTVPTRGSTAAAFTHGMSRAQDPHLHTHVLVANMAQGSDGRWSSLDGRALFAHARAAGALYRAQLRAGLADRIGVEWARTARGGLEIAGISPEVLGAFSARRAAIDEHMAIQGTGSGRSRRIAWAATREDKAVGDAAAAPEHWRAAAESLGLSATALRSLWHRPRSQGEGLDERRFAVTLGRSPDGVPRRAVIQAWADALDQGAPAEEIEGSVDRWLPVGGRAIGVSEEVHPIGGLLASSQLVRALGPRPTTAAGQDLWRAAADALTRHRARWGTRAHEPPVREATSRELAVLPVRQLADHVAVRRQVADLRRALGRTIERSSRRDGLGWER